MKPTVSMFLLFFETKTARYKLYTRLTLNCYLFIPKISRDFETANCIPLPNPVYLRIIIFNIIIKLKRTKKSCEVRDAILSAQIFNNLKIIK